MPASTTGSPPPARHRARRRCPAPGRAAPSRSSSIATPYAGWVVTRRAPPSPASHPSLCSRQAHRGCTGLLSDASPGARGGSGVTTSARPLRQERSAPADAATGAVPRGDHRSPDRIEGLDGLRALAIVGVLVYHLDAAWLPGGFLGVDVFFVVSGFLITTLLVREHRRTGRVALLAVLGAPGPTPAAGARAVRRDERPHRARRERRPARRRRAPDGRRPDLLDQLARDHRGVELLRPDRTAARS